MRTRGCGAILATACALIGGGSPAAASPGDPDPSFGADGIVLIDPPPDSRSYVGFRDVAIAADGSIFGAGQMGRPSDDNYDIAVAKFTPAGALDPTFNGGQFKRLALPGGVSSYAADATLDRDGKVLLVGASHVPAVEAISRVVVARLEASGALDQGFGSGGVLELPLPNTYEAMADLVAIQADGRILIAGRAYEQAAALARPFVARLLSDGTPDPSFDEDGIAVAQLWSSAHAGIPEAIAIDPSGRILLAGAHVIRFGEAIFQSPGSLSASCRTDSSTPASAPRTRPD